MTDQTLRQGHRFSKQPPTLQLLMLVALAGLFATSCARASGSPPGANNPSVISPGHGSARPVTIGPDDAGKSIALTTGDVLVFSSPNTTPPPRMVLWRLVSYPKNLITLISGSAGPPFRFRALHAGTGVLEISFGPSCGGPGPALGGPECPLAGDSVGAFPTRLLTFYLKVLAR